MYNKLHQMREPQRTSHAPQYFSFQARINSVPNTVPRKSYPFSSNFLWNRFNPLVNHNCSLSFFSKGSKAISLNNCLFLGDLTVFTILIILSGHHIFVIFEVCYTLKGTKSHKGTQVENAEKRWFMPHRTLILLPVDGGYWSPFLKRTFWEALVNL